MKTTRNLTMWGLSDSDGNLAPLNLSTQPYGLFTTKEEAERYVSIHDSGLSAIQVELKF